MIKERVYGNENSKKWSASFQRRAKEENRRRNGYFQRSRGLPKARRRSRHSLQMKAGYGRWSGQGPSIGRGAGAAL